MAQKIQIMHSRSEILASFERFLDVLDELREKCPWDRKQTNESLRPNTIEEVYELSDALVADDTQNICKELGDVLLHVAFYAKIAQEREQFDMKDVCDRLCEKLIYRHPTCLAPLRPKRQARCAKLGATETHRKGWQQESFERRAHIYAIAHKGIPYAGKGCQHRLRLG